MRLIWLSIVASAFFAFCISADDNSPEDQRILVSYDIDFEFFTKLGKKWREINNYKDNQLVRINPRGLIEAGGLKLETGESFLHHNIGGKSIIFFHTTKERHQVFRMIYKRFMGVPVLEISSERVRELIEAHSPQSGDSDSLFEEPEK